MSWTDKQEVNTEKMEIMTYEERRAKIREQVKDRLSQERAFLCCSISGNPKTGKSGTAMDCRTDEEIKKGMKICILDLDDGCVPTWYSAWDKDENIEIYVPYVYRKDGSVDWNETFENCHAWIDDTREKIAEGNVKAVILDGVDKVNEGSSDALREHLVKDAKRNGEIIHDTDSLKVRALDWRIRNKIHDRVINPFISLQCDRFFVTHMKAIYDGVAVPIPVGFEPDWHKSVPQKMLQMITISEQKKGNNTEYVARLDSCKTNPDLVGKEWCVFKVTSEGNEWFGIPELQTGHLKGTEEE